ncbi:hypothetical protein SCAR479_02758, partial [Seiridium cardinale]
INSAGLTGATGPDTGT